MSPLVILIGTGFLLFIVLVILVIVLVIQSFKEPDFKSPVREDLRKIKAQIEDTTFV